MRLRHVTGSETMVEENPFTVNVPAQYKGRWNGFFGNDKPLQLEIGMGKGRFITELAALHPEINYLGIEAYPTVLLQALKKQEERQLPNLRFLCINAAVLAEVFAPGEVSKIYLNFSDPWPKDRHAKRRLTSPAFLRLYRTVLRPDGCVEFKTDNRPLFDYSLETAEQEGWTVALRSYDLHADPVLSEGNILTEYEEKFSSRGNPICKMVCLP